MSVPLSSGPLTVFFQASKERKGVHKFLKSAVLSSDGSRRAYYKEFLKVVEAADVIIQVLDARDPLGSRCKEVERLVLKSGGLKRMVLLLNKIGEQRAEFTWGRTQGRSDEFFFSGFKLAERREWIFLPPRLLC